MGVKRIITKNLVQAILASIMSMSVSTSYATTTYDYVNGQWQSLEAQPKYDYYSVAEPGVSGAYQAVPVYGKNGKQVFELVYMKPDTTFIDWNSEYEMIEEPASPLINKALVVGTKYWADVLNTENTEPVQIFVVSRNNYNNASATPINFTVKNEMLYYNIDENMANALKYNFKLKPYTIPDDQELNEIGLEDSFGVGVIFLGDYFGGKVWDETKGFYGHEVNVEKMNHLSSAEVGDDLVATINHELTHILGMDAIIYGSGIETVVATNKNDAEDKCFDKIYYFPEEVNNLWNEHLMDQNGKMAKPGLFIASNADTKEIMTKNPELTMDDFFIIDNLRIESDLNQADYELQSHANEPAAGKAFFVGDNVSQLLKGCEDFKTPVEGVYGVPVNTWEKTSETNKYMPELSHTSLPILMSHSYFCNYATNTELELAIMKDLDYDIDIRNQYGRSVYGSNQSFVNTDGYSARNAEGTAYVPNTYNNAYMGVGLHVFGSNNTITQQGDILTNGLGALGIRIDGNNNEITVAKDTVVKSDGINGYGILQSYGSGHELKVEGTVTAEQGTAIRFDFGGNSVGSRGEYRGSYIRYLLTSDTTGIIEGGVNKAFDSIISASDGPAPVLNGALVEKFDISGTIKGGENAIYISKNAFVKDINVLDGANIMGNITSDWKDFAPKNDAAHTNYCYNTGDENEGYVKDNEYNENLGVRYKGNLYSYLDYIPDLVTSLNFNADFAYAGNITGKDNLRINVNEGTFSYCGTADVTKVTVAQNAILQGGTFKLNSMKDRVAEGFEDDNTGKLINEGMLSAALPEGKDTVLNITGDVVNNGGSFGFIGNAGYQGRIKIEGELSGDRTLAVNPNGIYLPGDSYDISDLVTVNGTNLEFDKALSYKQGLLEAIYSNENKQLSFALTDTIAAEVAEPAMEMGNLGRALAKRNKTEEMQQVAKLFGSDNVASVGKSLKAIKGQQAANIGAVMQQSNTIHKALGMRLSQVNRAKTVKVAVPVAQLDATKEPLAKIEMPIEVQPEYSMWAKVSRNKGTVNAESDYKTDAYSIGWDKQVNKDWRFGFFGSYSKGKFEAETINNSLEDYRLGVYGGYNKGPHEAMVYADYGWGKNKLRRGLNFINKATNAKYDSNIMEIGAEYKYDLQHDSNKTWHVKPYAALQINRYSQKAYGETGADPFNKNVAKLNNTYAGIEAGLDLERRFANGSAYGFRLGYKRGLTGVEAKQSYHYAADPEHRYTNHGEADKHKLVLSLNGEVQTASNWSISGEASYERGKKGHGYSGEVTLKYTW